MEFLLNIRIIASCVGKYTEVFLLTESIYSFLKMCVCV